MKVNEVMSEKKEERINKLMLLLGVCQVSTHTHTQQTGLCCDCLSAGVFTTPGPSPPVSLPVSLHPSLFSLTELRLQSGHAGMS